MIKAISLGGLLVSGWAVVEGFKLYGLGKGVNSWQGAIGVSFGNPNFLAGYLVVGLPFLAYLIDRSRHESLKRFWRVGLVVQMIAIGLSLSWGGMVGAGLFLMGWWLMKQKQWKKSYGWLLGLIILLGVGGFKLERQIKQRPLEIVAEARERIAMKGWLAWLKKPLLGWGWANFDKAFEAVDWPFKFKADVYVDKAHSSLLEVLVTTGAVGFLVYLLIIIQTIKLLNKSKRKEDKYYLLVFLLWLVHSQTNVVSIGEELMFWLVVAKATTIE